MQVVKFGPIVMRYYKVHINGWIAMKLAQILSCYSLAQISMEENNLSAGPKKESPEDSPMVYKVI